MGIFEKIKAAWKARKIVNEATKEVTVNGETKNGIQTSEFWTKNIVQLVVIANMFLKNDIDPNQALLLVGALEGLYIGGRSLVKVAKDIIKALKGGAQATA